MKSFVLYTVIIVSLGCSSASATTSIHYGALTIQLQLQRTREELQRRDIGVIQASTSRRKLQGRTAGGNNMNAGGAAGEKKVPATRAPSTSTPSALPIVPLTQTPSFSAKTPDPTPRPTLNPTMISEIPTFEPSTSPTVTPTFNPTVTTAIPTDPETNAPSVTATKTPTISPSSTTQTPSPLPLTFSPSTSMTSTILGFIELQFSIYAPEKVLVAVDVVRGKWPLLERQLEKVITNVLCKETDFIIVNEANDSVCQSSRRRRTLTNNDPSTIRHDLLTFSVKDRMIINSPQTLNYTLWTAHYPVTSVGDKYIENVIASKGNKLNEEELLSDSIHMMERVGQRALSASITSGQMDTMMSDGTVTSVINMETSTFLSHVDLGYTEQLNPAPLHALRLSGMIMLVTTTIMTILFMQLAQRRKKEREWDEEFKTLSSGGLVTEAGLEYMLDVGRSSQSMHTSNAEEVDDPDDEKKIPLPGAYMNVGYHPTLLPKTDAASTTSSVRGPREMT
jgi:hypothetical protein